MLSVGSILSTGLLLNFAVHSVELKPTGEIEEGVYTFTNADNGAGPMWCRRWNCLVRIGKREFASGLETISGAKPLNNCRWMLIERRALKRLSQRLI